MLVGWLQNSESYKIRIQMKRKVIIITLVLGLSTERHLLSYEIRNHIKLGFKWNEKLLS